MIAELLDCMRIAAARNVVVAVGILWLAVMGAS